MRIELAKPVSFVLGPGTVAVVCWAALRYEMPHGGILIFMLAALTTLRVTKLRLSLLFTGAPFLMLIGMVWGTHICVLAAAAYALLAVFILYTARAANARTIWLCASLMVCEAFLYCAAYRLLKAVSLFPAILAMAFVSYLVTSLVRHENEGWKERFPLIFNPFIAASCAAFIATFYREDSLAPLLAVPAVAVIWYWTQLHERRIRAKGNETAIPEPPPTQ